MALTTGTLNILGLVFLSLPHRHFKSELKMYQQPAVRVHSTSDEKTVFPGKKEEADVNHGLKQKVLS